MFNLISMFRHEVAVTRTTFRVRNTFSIICYTVSVCCLTHWGRVTHICVRKLTIIGSDNGLSPGRHQAIIWTNAVILLIWPLGTNFNEILIGIQTFSFKEMHLKMSSAKWRPFCFGLNVLSLIMMNKLCLVLLLYNYRRREWRHRYTCSFVQVFYSTIAL